MYDVYNIRKDFPMLKKTMQDHPYIFLDNCATTLKPESVMHAVCDYYQNYSANANRGDYDFSYQVDERIERAREHVAKFIHAKKTREIVFTSGASSALNLVAYGYGRKHLKKGDVILTTEAEHASCILPWMRVVEEKGAILKYIPLNEKGELTVEAVSSMMDEHVKMIVTAHITNVLGYIAPMKEICEVAHRYGALVLVDGAQSVPHLPTDVQDMDCDFLAFSGHKMCGPTGIGVLYGKMELLQSMDTLFLGGASNANYDMCGNIQLKQPPYKFEAGTQPLEAIFGLDAAITYLETLGMENIHQHETELHDYAIAELKKMDHIKLYNPDTTTGIITFNVKDIFGLDVAKYFNHHGIAVRTGQHCSKLLVERLEDYSTIRASIYLYTTKEDIDKFLEVCRNATKKNCFALIFKK